MGISTWYDDWTVALVLVCMPLLPQVYETNCLWFMNTALEVFGLAGLGNYLFNELDEAHNLLHTSEAWPWARYLESPLRFNQQNSLC